MRLVLTLLCRNEADVIDAHIRFHFAMGVDCILVIDNGSIDGTREILSQLANDFPMIVFDEPEHTHDQAVWVTKLAYLASTTYQADWIIHSDADEFWFPESLNLKQELQSLPSSIDAIMVKRHNFLPPLNDQADLDQPFYRRQIIRYSESLNSMGAPLPGKVCHRANPLIAVSDGNHTVSISGRSIPMHQMEGIEILHYPIRSYSQYKRKLSDGTIALLNNSRLHASTGSTWRTIYNEWIVPGRFPEYYASLIPSSESLQQQLTDGYLMIDHRLQQVLTR